MTGLESRFKIMFIILISEFKTSLCTIELHYTNENNLENQLKSSMATCCNFVKTNMTLLKCSKHGFKCTQALHSSGTLKFRNVHLLLLISKVITEINFFKICKRFDREREKTLMQQLMRKEKLRKVGLCFITDCFI